jgi:predicted lipid carrier protein YhbT
VTTSKSAVPRLPPLLGLAIRPLPLLPLQPLLMAFVRAVHARHFRIFERLGPYADKRFGIDPTDLPLAFILEPSRTRPRAAVVRSLPRRLDVRIAGPIAGLVGLLDGHYDGDALFFSRDLMIEGDVEAVLALRNALDDAGVDILKEGTALLGPLASPAEAVLRRVLSPREDRAGLSSEGRRCSWS